MRFFSKNNSANKSKRTTSDYVIPTYGNEGKYTIYNFKQNADILYDRNQDGWAYFEN